MYTPAQRGTRCSIVRRPSPAYTQFQSLAWKCDAVEERESPGVGSEAKAHHRWGPGCTSAWFGDLVPGSGGLWELQLVTREVQSLPPPLFPFP